MEDCWRRIESARERSNGGRRRSSSAKSEVGNRAVGRLTMDHVLENEERADAIILCAADSVWRSVKVTMRRSVGSCEDVEAIKGPGVVMGTYLVPKWSARVTGSVSCAKAKAPANFSFVRPKLSQRLWHFIHALAQPLTEARAASKQAPQAVNTLQNYVDVAFTRASQPSRL